MTKSNGRAKARGIVEVDLTSGRARCSVWPAGKGRQDHAHAGDPRFHPASRTLLQLGLDSVTDAVQIKRRVTYLPGEPWRTLSSGPYEDPR